MNVEPWSTVAQGAAGAVVKGIQYLLRAQGHQLAADGAFGPITKAAVSAVQTAKGLPVDGVVGPVTWPYLVVASGMGSTGEEVRAVQQFGLLRSPGDTLLAIDGKFGPLTKERIEFFQESWGLALDGVAGRETWSFLSTLVPGPRPWPLVKPGATQATNWRVLAAQHLLRAHGASIVADGVFGPASAAAVNAFQQTLRNDRDLLDDRAAGLAGAHRDDQGRRARRGGAGAADAPGRRPRRRRGVRCADRCGRARFPEGVPSAGRWNRRAEDLAGPRRAAVRLTRRQPLPASEAHVANCASPGRARPRRSSGTPLR